MAATFSLHHGPYTTNWLQHGLTSSASWQPRTGTLTRTHLVSFLFLQSTIGKFRASKSIPSHTSFYSRPETYSDSRGIHDDPSPRSIIIYEGETYQGAGDGKIVINFIRYLLTGRPGVPKLAASPDCTPRQIEALHAIEALSREHSLNLDVRPGDMAFVNNWSILHPRTAFRDDEEHVRYVVRI